MTKSDNIQEATRLMQLDITYRAILRVFETIAKHDITDNFELSTLAPVYLRAVHYKDLVIRSDNDMLLDYDMIISDNVTDYAFDRQKMRNVQRRINDMLVKQIASRIHKVGVEYIDQAGKNQFINDVLIPVEETIQEHIDPRQQVSSLIPGGNNYGIVSVVEEYDESVLYRLYYVSGKADSELRIKSKDGDFVIMDILAGDDLQEVFDTIFEDKVRNLKHSDFPNSLKVNTLINNRFRDMPEALRKTLFSTKTRDKQQRRLFVNTVITDDMLSKRGFERADIDEYLKTLKK